jgi:enoyl-[acyl-carrier-protein] reductase (NADH)
VNAISGPIRTLASPLASGIIGQVIYVDAGLHHGEVINPIPWYAADTNVCGHR